MAKNPTKPMRIEGKIISVDGEETEFHLATDATWQQWGNTVAVCWRNTELLGAIALASAEHLEDEEEDD